MSTTRHRFDAASSSIGDGLLITHARHRAHLEAAAAHLEAFVDTGMGSSDVVLGAEELRYAASEIGKIGGHVDVEDVLDVIFSKFCVGK